MLKPVIRMKKKTAKKTSFKDFILDKKNIPVCIIVLVLLSAFVFSGWAVASSRADISRLEVQKEEISQKLEAQEAENARLDEVLNNEDKDEYIEQKAREKGYVKSDEIVFYDISAGE